MSETLAVDCRDIGIREGDTIVYPGRKGSSLWMNTGTVLAPSHPMQSTLTVRKANGRVVEIFDTARVAVVQAAASI